MKMADEATEWLEQHAELWLGREVWHQASGGWETYIWMPIRYTLVFQLTEKQTLHFTRSIYEPLEFCDLTTCLRQEQAWRDSFWNISMWVLYPNPGKHKLNLWATNRPEPLIQPVCSVYASVRNILSKRTSVMIFHLAIYQFFLELLRTNSK